MIRYKFDSFTIGYNPDELVGILDARVPQFEAACYAVGVKGAATGKVIPVDTFLKRMFKLTIWWVRILRESRNGVADSDGNEVAFKDLPMGLKRFVLSSGGYYCPPFLSAYSISNRRKSVYKPFGVSKTKKSSNAVRCGLLSSCRLDLFCPFCRTDRLIALGYQRLMASQHSRCVAAYRVRQVIEDDFNPEAYVRLHNQVRKMLARKPYGLANDYYASGITQTLDSYYDFTNNRWVFTKSVLLASPLPITKDHINKTKKFINSKPGLEVDSYTVLSKGDDEKFDSIDLAKLLGTYASYYMSRINDHDFALSISNLVSWRINKSGVRWPRVSSTKGSFRRVEVDDEISPRYVRSKLYGGIVACESA